MNLPSLAAHAQDAYAAAEATAQMVRDLAGRAPWSSDLTEAREKAKESARLARELASALADAVMGGDTDPEATRAARERFANAAARNSASMEAMIEPIAIGDTVAFEPRLAGFDRGIVEEVDDRCVPVRLGEKLITILGRSIYKVRVIAKGADPGPIVPDLGNRLARRVDRVVVLRSDPDVSAWELGRDAQSMSPDVFAAKWDHIAGEDVGACVGWVEAMGPLLPSGPPIDPEPLGPAAAEVREALVHALPGDVEVSTPGKGFPPTHKAKPEPIESIVTRIEARHGPLSTGDSRGHRGGFFATAGNCRFAGRGATQEEALRDYAEACDRDCGEASRPMRPRLNADKTIARHETPRLGDGSPAEPGREVRHQSGGVAMRITAIQPLFAKCEWDGGGGWFLLSALVAEEKAEDAQFRLDKLPTLENRP